MTRVCMAVVCATLVAAPTVVAQRTFIGTIHYDLVNKGKHIELVATSDGERFRQDVVPRDSIANAYPFTMIVDNLVGDVIWLMPLTHRYSQRHLEAGAPMPEEQRKLE